MKIDFINKINKENNSLTTLVINDKEYPLTEKELARLLRLFHSKREDIFESEGLIENNEDKRTREELENEVERLQDIIDSIRDSADY